MIHCLFAYARWLFDSAHQLLLYAVVHVMIVVPNVLLNESVFPATRHAFDRLAYIQNLI